MLTKVQSALMASEAGIPVVLTRSTRYPRRCSGNRRVRSSCPRRAFTAPDVAGACDNGPRCSEHRRGAVKALRDRQASLLAAGVVSVSGNFSAGEPVTSSTARACWWLGTGRLRRPRVRTAGGRTTSELIEQFGPG